MCLLARVLPFGLASRRSGLKSLRSHALDSAALAGMKQKLQKLQKLVAAYDALAAAESAEMPPVQRRAAAAQKLQGIVGKGSALTWAEKRRAPAACKTV